MTILITGGGGFIGCHLARDLVDRGQEVVLMDIHLGELPSFLAPYLDQQVKRVQGDMRDLAFLYRVIKECKVDSMIHAASLHETTGALYTALQVNLDGTIEVLEAARIFGLRRVSFISSVMVYVLNKSEETLQEDLNLPWASLGYISGTKKAGEQVCQLYAKEYGMSIPIVRPSDVWGPLYRSGRQRQQVCGSGKHAFFRPVQERLGYVEFHPDHDLALANGRHCRALCVLQNPLLHHDFPVVVHAAVVYALACCQCSGKHVTLDFVYRFHKNSSRIFRLSSRAKYLLSYPFFHFV